MDDNKNISETLKELKKQIVEQIESLKVDLEAVERLLKKHSVIKDAQLPIFSNISLALDKAVGPTKAIMQIFNGSPNKAWTPSELRDKLSEIKENGLLSTNAIDLLSVVHTVLGAHVKNGSIIKDSNKRIPTYRRKI